MTIYLLTCRQSSGSSRDLAKRLLHGQQLQLRPKMGCGQIVCVLHERGQQHGYSPANPTLFAKL